MTTAHDMYAAVFNAYYGGPERYKARDEGPKPVIVAHSPPGERLWLRVRMPNGDTWDYGANSDELSNDILEQNFPRVMGKFNLRKPRNIGRLLSHIRELSKNPDSITATKLQPRGKAPIPAVEPSTPPAIEEPEDELLEQEFDREADPLQETLATEHAGESQYSAQAKHAGEPHDRLALLLEKAGNARAIKLGKPGSKAFFIVSPSTREASQGQWQLSRFDDSGPTGHRNFNTKEEAIGGAIGINPTPTRQKSLFDDYSNLGDPSYDITEKYTTTFDADAILAYYGQDANVERYAKGFGLPKRRNTIKPTAGQQDLFGKGAAEEQPAMQPPAPVASETVANPPQTSQEKPAMAASRQMQKTLGFSTKASHPLSEHGMEKFEGETHKFHVENPTIDLPEGRELVDTRHIVHNGKLFRVSIISDPSHGRHFNIEEGTVTNPEMAIKTQGEQSTPTQTFGHVQVKMEPASFETLQGIAHSNEFAPVRAMIERTATRNQTQGGAPGRETAKSMAGRVLSQVKGHGKPLIEDVLKKSLGLPANEPLPKGVLKAIKSLRERGEIKVGKTESRPVQIVITKASKSKPKAKSQATEDPSKLRQEIRSREKELKSLEELAKGQTGEQLEVTSQKIDKASKELDKMRVQAIQLREGEIKKLKKRPQPQLAMVDPKHGQSPRMSAGDARLNKISRAIQSIQKRIKPLQQQFDSLSPEEQEATPSPRLDSLLDRLKNLTTARDAAVRARKQAATTTKPRFGGPAENPPLPKQNIRLRRGMEGQETAPSIFGKKESPIDAGKLTRVSDAITSVRKRLRDLNRKLSRTSEGSPQRKRLESQIADYTRSYKRLAEQRNLLSPPRYQPFSNAARRLIDATLERYTALRARDSLLRRFCANYYGTVERYGGQQSGPHIDNQSILNGVSIPALTKPIKMQALPTDGQPRGAKGSLNPGQFTGPGKLPSITPLPSPVKMSLPDQYAARGKSRQTTAHGIPMIGGIPIADPTMFLSWPAPPREEEAVKKGARPLSTAQQRPLTWEGTNQLAALAVSTGKQVYQKQQQIDSLQAQARQMSGPEQASVANQIQSLSQERDELLKKHNEAAGQTIEDLDRHFHWRVGLDKKASPEFRDDLVQYYRTYVWDALNRWTKGKKGYDPEKTYNPTQAGIQTFIKTAEKAIKGRFWRDRKNFVQGLTEDAADDIHEQHERELTGEKGEQQPKKRRGRAIIQQFDENYDDTEGGRHVSEARWDDTATTPELVDRLLTELRHTTNRKAIIKNASQTLRNKLKDFQESRPTKFKDLIKLSELDAKTKKQIAVLSKANNDIDRYSKSLQQSANDTWARIHRELQGLSKKAQLATDPKSLEQIQASLSGLQSSMKALSDELPQHGMTIPLPDPSWAESKTPDSPISKARHARINGVREGFSKLLKHDQDLLKLHFGISGGVESGKTLKQIEKEIKANPEYRYIAHRIHGSSPTRIMEAIRSAERRLYDRLPENLRVEIAGGEGVPKGVPSQKKFVTLTADYITSIVDDDINQKREMAESQGVKRKPLAQPSDLSSVDNPSTRKKWAIIQGESPTEKEIGESRWHGEHLPYDETGEFSSRTGDIKLKSLKLKSKVLEEQLQQVMSSLPILPSGRRAKPTGAVKRKIQLLKRMVADSQKGVANRSQELHLRYAPARIVDLAGDLKALKGIESEISKMWRQSDIDPESGRHIDERWFEHRDSPVAMDYEDIVKMHKLYTERDNLLKRTGGSLSPLSRFEITTPTPEGSTQPPQVAAETTPATPKQPWETPATAPLQTKKKRTKSKGPSGPTLFTRQSKPDKYGFVTDAAGIELTGDSSPTYEETLASIPLRPSKFPSPPKQPRNTGERWAIHTGMADIDTLKRVKAAADRRGLVLKVVVPQTGTGKQQAGKYRFYTFTKKGLERFRQQGRPARYRAGLDKYGWRSIIGLPEKQQAPPPLPPPKKPWDVPIGGDDLLDVPRPQTSYEEWEARKTASPPILATAQSPPTPQTTVQRTQQPLSKKDIDELSRIQSYDAKFREWLRDPTQGPAPDPTEMVTMQSSAPASTTKKASQLTPEQQKKKQELRDRELKLREARISRAEEREKERLKGGGTSRGRSGAEKTKVIVPEEFQITKTLPQSPPTPDGQKIPMTIGKATEIYADDYLPVQAYYAITELHNLAPSHIIKDDSSIAPNPNYKNPGAQPRNYEPGSRNHEKVLRHYAQKRHRYWTTDNPDPVAGPPTVDEQGQVSNANGRTITLLYLAARELSGHAGEYDWMRKALSESAEHYGISPDEVAKYKFPVLVRITPTIRAGTPEFDELARAGNRRTQQTEDPIGEAASMSKKVAPDELLADLQKKNLISGNMTLSDVLSDKNHPLVKALYNEVKQSADVASYFDDEGSLHAEGRNRAENVLLGRFIENVPLLRRADYQFRSFKNAVGDALPAIIAIGEPIKKQLESAVKYVVTHPAVKSYQHFLDDTGRQKSLIETGNEADPIALSLLDAMYRTKKTTKTGKSVWNSAAMINMFSNMAAAVKHRRLAESGRSLLGPPKSDISSDLVDAIEGSTTQEALERSEIRRARDESSQSESQQSTPTRSGIEEQSRHAAPASPRQQEKRLFTGRMSCDATLDLYTAVHMAYYGKRRRHQRGTARKFIS